MGLKTETGKKFGGALSNLPQTLIYMTYDLKKKETKYGVSSAHLSFSLDLINLCCSSLHFKKSYTSHPHFFYRNCFAAVAAMKSCSWSSSEWFVSSFFGVFVEKKITVVFIVCWISVSPIQILKTMKVLIWPWPFLSWHLPSEEDSPASWGPGLFTAWWCTCSHSSSILRHDSSTFLSLILCSEILGWH